MAADLGFGPDSLEKKAMPSDKGPGTSMNLMERLRGRCGQHKSWSDSIKAVRIALMSDKRVQSEALEKPQLQHCLDQLHRALKIVNQQSLVERLELIARQLGLVFTPPSVPENHIYLAAEMFRIEIVLDGQGGVKDVRIEHQEASSSCEELVEVLSKRDFDEFILHLRGLLSIYNIVGDRKQKTKAYLALSSLEADLNLLAQLQSSINGVANYIHKSPLGILLPRKGGHPMKLIYFVSPYDLLCKKTKSSHAMTVEAITENTLGHSVTVCLEPWSTHNKLQTMPLMSVKTHCQDRKSLPSFQGLTTMNSQSLPASFVLVLPHPVPLASSVIQSIQEITGLAVVHSEEKQLLSLLLDHASHGRITDCTELFVTLPDQQHAYYLNNLSEGCLGKTGALVTKIPFTHPTCVANVLNCLRQQLVFNAAIESLIRPLACKNRSIAIAFELTALSLQYLSVIFENPLQNAMVTVEVDLSDITCVKCRVCTSNGDENICSDEFVSRAFQRCFSIPVTLRMVIQKVQEQIRKLKPPECVKQTIQRPRLRWRSGRSTQLRTKSGSDVPPPPPPTQQPSSVSDTWPHVPSSVSDTWPHVPQLQTRKYHMPFHLSNINRTFSEPAPSTVEDRLEKPLANPLLATLLDQGSPALEQIPTNDSPMLSKLLEEHTSVATNPPAFPVPNPKQKRFGKRKSSKDMTVGKSPKHRLSESDMSDKMNTSTERVRSERFGQGIAEKHIDLDSSGGSYEGLDPARPPSVGSVSSIGGQSTGGSIIDLTDIGESHVKKLENSLDSIMQKETHSGNMGMMNMTAEMMDMQMPDFQYGNSQHSIGDGSHVDTHHAGITWPPRHTPPSSTSRNSPHHGLVPKNEKASTSLEDILTGPGDGREPEVSGSNSNRRRRNSSQAARRGSLKRQNCVGGRSSVDSVLSGKSGDVFSPTMPSPNHPMVSPRESPHHSMVSPRQSPHHSMVSPRQSPHHTMMSPRQSPHDHMVSPGQHIVSPVHHMETSPSQFSFAHNIKTEPGFPCANTLDSKSGILPTSSSPNVSCCVSNTTTTSSVRTSQHLSSSTGGKPSLSTLRAQLEMKPDFTSTSGGLLTQERDIFKREDNVTPSVMKLKLSNMRSYDNISPPDSDNSKVGSTFDFHSDDDEEYFPVMEKSMTVISASPTRLQITNKSRVSSFNKFNKSEKVKRREAKHSNSDSGKRKRDKDENKKERKNKKLKNSTYSTINDKALYRSTVTVGGVGENNFSPMPKLKITKRGLQMKVENSYDSENSMDKIVKCEKVEDFHSISDKKQLVIELAKVMGVSDKLCLDKTFSVSQIEQTVKKPVKKCDTATSAASNHSDVSAGANCLANTSRIIKTESSAVDAKCSEIPQINVKPTTSINTSENLSGSNAEKKVDVIASESSKNIIDSSVGKNFSSAIQKALNISESVENGIVQKVSDGSPSHKTIDKSVDNSRFARVEKLAPARTPSVSDEGIFDKIAAMKTAPVTHATSSTTNSSENSNKKISSKSQKAHRRSQSGKPDAKLLTRTPTVKLKPITVPLSSCTMTNVSPSRTTHTTPKSLVASPTTTTIGKIGAVSLATSGSQKHYPSTPTSKSPQGSAKHSISSNKTSTAGTLTSKSTSSLQKTIHMTGGTGKNSPNSQSLSKSSSSNSRSSSVSGPSSKLDKNITRTLSASGRTSSPLTTKEKRDSSSSRNSNSSRDRNREKSTSSSKSSVPVTTVITQETAASVLSFLNPKASSILNLPPIPKLKDGAAGKASTPTTTTTMTIMSTSITTSSSTKNTNSVPSFSQSKGNIHNMSFNKSNNGGNRPVQNRMANPAVTNPVFSNRAGSNSPINYSNKGNYNSSKGNNSSASSNKSNTFNLASNRNTAHLNKNLSGSNLNTAVHRGNNSSNMNRGTNSNTAHTGTHRGNNPSPSNRGSNYASSVNRSSVPSNASPSTSFRSSNSATYAPKGPGPPISSAPQNPTPVDSKRKAEIKSPSAATAAARGRKGSLSAVIDKLFKAAVPQSSQKPGLPEQKSKRVVNESPASPEPECNTKLSRNVNEKTKVVINESPESPEPDIAAVKAVDLNSKQRKKSDSNIVSIPLDKQKFHSPDTSTRPGNNRNMQTYRVGENPSKIADNRTSQHSVSHSHKTLPSPLDMPKIIPLVSERGTPSPVRLHASAKQNDALRRLSSDGMKGLPINNGEILEDEDLRVLLKHALPAHYRPKNDTRKSCDSPNMPVDYSNPSRRSSANELSDKTTSGLKTSSPKLDYQQRKSHSSVKKPVLSPESPVSSPENGLVIDYPGSNSSPRFQPKNNSPQVNLDLSRTTQVRSKLKQSAGVSPPGRENRDSLSDASSPCYLDDDLMDEALGIGN